MFMNYLILDNFDYFCDQERKITLNEDKTRVTFA